MQNNNELRDYGPFPITVNIERATERNNNFRTALWTGKYLQITLMSINPGQDIGAEVHPYTDQFIRIEQGEGLARFGNRRDNYTFQRKVGPSDAMVIPAGTWHNLVNIGKVPLKVYSIYAPPQHPRGTVHKTKADALAAERQNH
jgi:mannose-6-phosphate isomerase-like protein (cupin superfamily)